MTLDKITFYKTGMELKTADDVIDTLGGTAVVAKLFDRHMQAVSSWRGRKITSKLFLVMQAKLQEMGHTASPTIWGIEEP